jgi:hypothetical protein
MSSSINGIRFRAERGGGRGKKSSLLCHRKLTRGRGNKCAEMSVQLASPARISPGGGDGPPPWRSPCERSKH